MIKENVKKIVFMFVIVFFGSILQSQDLIKPEINKKRVLVKKITSTIIDGDDEFVVLKKKHTQFDNKGRFIYKLKRNYGIKTYLNFREKNNKELIIYKGLLKGDEILISVLIKIGDDLIKGKFISSSTKVPVLVMEKDRRYGKYFKRKKRKTSKKVKYEFEVGLSFAKNTFDEFYVKDKVQEELIKQYANLYTRPHAASGTYPELGSFMPISLGMNYMISKDLYIKAGFELASTSALSSKEFTINWIGFDQDYDYSFSHKTSYFLPYIGIEKRFNDFSAYANLGINSVKYDYIMTSKYTEQSYNENTTETINGSGSAFSIILGIKYRKRIFDKLHGIIKLEYLLSKVGSITADRVLIGSNSEGGSVSDSTTGVIYSYDKSPYNSSKINTWDVFESIPTTSGLSNFEELGINLSTIRLSIGLSF